MSLFTISERPLALARKFHKMVKRKRAAEAEIVPICCEWKDCELQFLDDLQLNTHLASHLEEYKDQPVCPWGHCEFATADAQELHRHIYYHGYYACLLRNGKSECESNDKVPMCSAPTRDGDKVPNLPNDFRCEWIDCDRQFVSIVEFQDHIVQHATFEYEASRTADDERPKTRCKWNYCSKQMDNKYRLVEHVRTHSNRKDFACYNCGELFRTRTTLYDHLRRQEDNNNHQYPCGQCFKCFATEKLLRSHMLKHVYRFKCTLCDMTCYSSASLAVHFRYRHLNDKPFECPQCDHRCVRKGDLAKHVHFAHSKEVLHCTEPGCNYAVRSHSLLRRHFFEVHGNSPFIYICHVCGKTFKKGKSLSVHLIKKHQCQLPSGHKRFTYRLDENGFFRVQMKRIESLDVTKQILSPSPYEVTQDSSCYEIVCMTQENEERIIVASDADNAMHLAGKVVISLPTTVDGGDERF